MTDNDLSRPADVTEQNLERLLEKAYKPEAPSPDSSSRCASVWLPRPGSVCRPCCRCAGRSVAAPLWMLAAAAAIAGLAFLLHTLATPLAQVQREVVQDQPREQPTPPAPVMPSGPEELGPPRRPRRARAAR